MLLCGYDSMMAESAASAYDYITIVTSCEQSISPDYCYAGLGPARLPEVLFTDCILG